jgi:hypothetical protein
MLPPEEAHVAWPAREKMPAPVDPRFWSVSEAVALLCPWLPVPAARAVVRAARLQPAGARHSSAELGRPATTYAAADLIALFGAMQVPEQS